MNNNVCMRIVMFISSYFPLYIMLLILNLDKYSSIEKITTLIKDFSNNIYNLGFLVFLIITILVSIYSLFDLHRTTGNEFHRIGIVKRPDDTVISYMMTYIIPLLTTENLTNKMTIINLILFLLIGYLYIRLHLIYLNPLWAIFGYIMYQTDCNKVLVTNIRYEKMNKINNKTLKCRLLSSNIYLVKEEDNLDLI